MNELSFERHFAEELDFLEYVLMTVGNLLNNWPGCRTVHGSLESDIGA